MPNPGQWQGFGTKAQAFKQIDSSAKAYNPANYQTQQVDITPVPIPQPQSNWWSGVLGAASTAGNYIKNEASFGLHHPITAAENIGKGLISSETGLYHTVNDVIHGRDTGKTPLQIAAEIGGVGLDAFTLSSGALVKAGIKSAAEQAIKVAAEQGIELSAKEAVSQATKDVAANIATHTSFQKAAKIAGLGGAYGLDQGLQSGQTNFGDLAKSTAIGATFGLGLHGLGIAGGKLLQKIGVLPVHDVPASAYHGSPATAVATPEELLSKLQELDQKGISPVASTPLPGDHLGVLLKDNTTGQTATHIFVQQTPELKAAQEAYTKAVSDLQAKKSGAALEGSTQSYKDAVKEARANLAPLQRQYGSESIINAVKQTGVGKVRTENPVVPVQNTGIQAAPTEAALGQDVKLPSNPEMASASPGSTGPLLSGEGQPVSAGPSLPQEPGVPGQPGTSKSGLPQGQPEVASLPPPETRVQDGSSGGNVSRQRGFVNTLQESSKVSPEMKAAVAAIDPQSYVPLSNKEGVAKARDFVSQNESVAHSYVTDENTPWSAAKGHIGGVLLDRYAAAGDAAKFSEISNSMDIQARQAGQGNQALAKYGEMSPPNILKVADATAARHGQTLTEEFRAQIIKQANELGKMEPGSPERIAATQGLVKDIASQIKTTKGEWFTNYRYQNMLSSPTPLEKIGFSGLFNTFITHPADLFGQSLAQASKSVFSSTFERSAYFSDIPKYYKQVVLGMPDAWKAAVESFTTDNMGSKFQEGSSVGPSIEQARRGNIPVALRAFSASHGAAYSYFKSLISGGESARLMSHGVDEASARKAGDTLANRLTLRSRPGTEPNAAPLVKAVEAIGTMVSDISKQKNVFGGSMRWIAPFMRVSTNLAAQAVEHSPLALVDWPKNITSERFGKAFVGSLITGVGVMAAAEGRVSLAAPTDAKAKDLFFAAGNKPYSVRVGNVSVPLQYFGPYALSMMLPQAVMEADSGSNAGSDVVTKTGKAVQNVIQGIVNTTPLPTIAQFFAFLKGDTTINIQKIGASLVGQVIPLEALLRYTADIVDPIYRKPATKGAASFTENIQSGIPGLTQSLPAYTRPDGTPETRNITNSTLPYATGNINDTFNTQLQNRQDQLTTNATTSATAQKIADTMSKGDMAGAIKMIQDNYDPQDQATAYTTALKAASSDSGHVDNRVVDFFGAYTPVKNQRDKVATQVKDLVRQGKVNQANRAVNDYNQSISGQFDTYLKKYGSFTGDANTLVRGLRIGGATISNDAKSKRVPSF